MASWKGKLNFPKPSPTASSTLLTSANNTANATTAEPQPSTSRGASSMAFCTTAAGSSQTNGYTRPSNITEQPVIRDWIQQKKAENPNIAKLTFEGFTYAERIDTFVENNWPDWASQSNSSKRSSAKKKKRNNSVVQGPEVCTAQALALAGFMMCPDDLQVKCFMCHRRKNMEEFSSITDPWEVHKKLFPDCPIVKQGKQSRPDSYGLSQALALMGECEAMRLEYEYERLEQKISGMMDHIDGKEMDDE